MADSDKEEVPILDETRKEREELHDEVQEIRESLLRQLDDPAYENLDCDQLARRSGDRTGSSPESRTSIQGPAVQGRGTP